jgi:two-component system sensor histidine kinase YesM
VEAADIARFQRDFLSFALWASMAGLLLAFFLAFGISYRLYRNVIRLVSFIGTPSGAGSEADARGELNYITGSITGLTARNRHIEHELAEKLAELKKAQAIALQNQINPHFILNTLQIVNLDVLKHLRSDSNATRIIALLSDILQANLNITDHLVPLSFELRQAVKYIEIENIRNKERFLVDWEIDEELTEYRTVKFVLQPLLENSFKHGLMNSGREKRVSVRAWLEDKTLVISVRDNGLGMAPDALDNLRQRLRKSHIQENRHIGLCNVDKRIRLVFGDAYGVSVESTSGEGTLVMIRQKPVRGDWSEG